MSEALNYAGPMTQARRYDGAAWWWARTWYALGAIVAPLVCWGSSFLSMSPPHPEWQSGRWSDMAGVLLAGQASWPMFGLIVYSMVSMSLLLINRPRFADWYVVRLGIYGGVFVAGLYSVVLMFSTDAVGGVISGIVLGGIVVPVTAMWWLIRRFGMKWILVGVGVLAAGGLILWALAALASFRISTLLGPVTVAWIGTLGSGPVVAFCALVAMTWWLLRRAPSARTAVAIGGWLGWLFSFGGSAWATAVAAMHYYQSLPTTAPSGCYIASTAARGHRRFVGARLVRCADGRMCAVNHQLRVLKAGEVVIEAVAPGVHAAMRRVYDAIGPWLALRIANRCVADAAYLFLKCFEWPTAIGLRVMGLWPLVMRLYPDTVAANIDESDQ